MITKEWQNIDNQTLKGGFKLPEERLVALAHQSLMEEQEAPKYER